MTNNLRKKKNNDSVTVSVTRSDGSLNDATLPVNTNILSGSSLDYGFPLLVDTTGTIHTRDGAHGIHSHTCANEENMNDGTKVGPTPTDNTPGNGVDMVVSIESIRAISERFANIWFLSRKFCSVDGLDTMLENGPWLNSMVSPLRKFSEDGLSAIATKIGTPLILDSYTSDMCIQSWGRSSYARAMIELRADVELKDTIVVAMPKIAREGFYIGFGEAKNLKKPSQTPRGVSVGPKVGFQPAKQVYKPVSKKPTTNTSRNKKKNMESTKEIERLIIDGKVTFMDDKGKPLEKVDSSGDYDSEDEVASVDNEMAIFLAFKKDGYGTNSLLEQWRETYENADYDYDPYDDDMYEGQEVPKKFQSICDNLDIKVRCRKKK
ncbi:hypothetical protein Tco_0771647 [Tanacetum coccineum]|uniref:Uncharacterized protein n=1 Tax=Tanacetum coccineum TaxID=301880 RepID=A0ABQ4ZI90_9ASTR